MKAKAIIIILLVINFIILLKLLIGDNTVALLDPQGFIALRQRDLMIIAAILTTIILVPVFLLTFFISMKYRSGNARAPSDGKHIPLFEASLWVVPTVLVLIFAFVTYKSTHALDPYKPLDVIGAEPVKIQVVALQWKWLFIYPEENIATVNFVQFPANTPINFELTADAPMNSFWIPQLGGQMYAMTGMVTKLHLIADREGDYAGSSAEISGRGFAGMRFVARATSESEFDEWVNEVRTSGSFLDREEYERLMLPSENEPAKFYSATEDNLYNNIVNKFMGHDYSVQTPEH